MKLEKISGSRASFATECALLPPPPHTDTTDTAHPKATVLLEGHALALLKLS